MLAEKSGPDFKFKAIIAIGNQEKLILILAYISLVESIICPFQAVFHPRCATEVPLENNSTA